MSVEAAQRIVIKSLSQRKNESPSYVPNSASDRKLWYLELLEQQIDSADTTIKNLKDFTKKLQIEISGNLSSAASIKAASMDMA